jgi:phage host-nuclease inhibitor protein Gam
MNSKRTVAKWLMLGTAAMLMVACANKEMDAAQQALAGVDSALSAVPADASTYIPDQVADVNKRRAELKASFDKKDYAAVVSGAPDVLGAAQSLVSETAGKKAAAAAEWTSLSAALPGEVEALRKRVDELSKSRHVPKGENLTMAQTGLADASARWDKAQASDKAGNLAEAVTSAREAKTAVETAGAAVKLTLPEPPKKG